MIDELSILIPVYNDDATSLVESFHTQASAIDGLRFEIVLFDDGSTNTELVASNKSLERLAGVRFVASQHHSCRAAMRNDMISQARFAWCVMVDARLTLLHPDFVRRYLESGIQKAEAVCGGVCVCGGTEEDELYRTNLRFRYEKFEERNHSVAARQRAPYQSFRTTNIFFHRGVFERTRYDERVKGYGYEDVLLGKAFEESNVVVRHIDNPVAYVRFEANELYLAKLEEALRTLHCFAVDLQGYSPLLQVARRLDSLCMRRAVCLWHRAFGALERHVLCGRHPRLIVLKLYKLGYYMSLR